MMYVADLQPVIDLFLQNARTEEFFAAKATSLLERVERRVRAATWRAAARMLEDVRIIP
jgi:hypothetical protein